MSMTTSGANDRNAPANDASSRRSPCRCMTAGGSSASRVPRWKIATSHPLVTSRRTTSGPRKPVPPMTAARIRPLPSAHRTDRPITSTVRQLKRMSRGEKRLRSHRRDARRRDGSGRLEAQGRVEDRLSQHRGERPALGVLRPIRVGRAADRLAVGLRHRSWGLRQRRPGDREGVTLRRKERAGRLDHLLARHGTELPRITFDVVGPELEELAFEHLRRDAARALARHVELADELVLREGEIRRRDLAFDDLPQLFERHADRALDVHRVHAHPDDPRRLATRAAERAEHVVRQAELVTHHMTRTARERVRGEDHVRHARGDEARIVPWKPGPADHHVALRLVRHDDQTSQRARERRLGDRPPVLRRGRRPASEGGFSGLENAVRLGSPRDNEHGAAWPDRPAMVRPELVRGHRPDDIRVTDRPRAERMADRVGELAPRALDDGARVALVLLDLRQGLLAHELDLLRAEPGANDRVGHELEQHREIVGKRLRAERGGVQPDVEPRRGADAVEGVRPCAGRTCRRTAQQRLRDEARDAGAPCGLEPLPRLDRQQRSDGAQAGDRRDGHPQPVREAVPANLHQERGSGTNQPTVRPRSTNTAAAAARTSSAVTAVRRSYHSSMEVAAPVASSWPARNARQVIVSVMNAFAESICRRTRANSSSVSGSRAMRASSSPSTRSTSWWATCGRSVASTTKRYGSFISWKLASTSVAMPVSTSAR